MIYDEISFDRGGIEFRLNKLLVQRLEYDVIPISNQRGHVFHVSVKDNFFANHRDLEVAVSDRKSYKLNPIEPKCEHKRRQYKTLMTNEDIAEFECATCGETLRYRLEQLNV